MAQGSVSCSRLGVFGKGPALLPACPLVGEHNCGSLGAGHGGYTGFYTRTDENYLVLHGGLANSGF